MRVAEVVTAGHGECKDIYIIAPPARFRCQRQTNSRPATSTSHLDEKIILDEETDLATVPNSQTSSSENSIASQESQREPTSQNTSQSSIDHIKQLQAGSPLAQIRSSAGSPDAALVDVHQLNPASAVKEDGTGSQPILITHNTHEVLQAGYAADNFHGQKRTASGHVKSTSSSLTTSPIELLGKAHSRNSSTTTPGTQINEVQSVACGSFQSIANCSPAVRQFAHQAFICYDKSPEWLADKNH